eukprot:3065738-Amphidinium_carterae.1
MLGNEVHRLPSAPGHSDAPSRLAAHIGPVCCEKRSAAESSAPITSSLRGGAMGEFCKDLCGTVMRLPLFACSGCPIHSRGSRHLGRKAQILGSTTLLAFH